MFDDPYAIDEEEEFLVDDDFDSYSEVRNYNSKSFSVKLTKMTDGLGTLALVADTLREYAEFLDSMYDEGYQLSTPIIDGIGFAYLVTEEAN